MESFLYSTAKYNKLIITNNFNLANPSNNEEDITSLLLYFSKNYKNKIVLYGGQTATPETLGYKKMRDMTSDIDYACKKSCIRQIVKNENPTYHIKYDIFFIIRKNIPITFSIGHIHNWTIDKKFFSSSKKTLYKNSYIYSCSREYSILLKLLRYISCITESRDFFGKDAIDIINLLMAEYKIKSNFNFNLFKNILYKNTLDGKKSFGLILDHIYSHKNHLCSKDIEKFENIFNTFKYCINSV